MGFNDRLNGYISDLECSAKDLADASGISTAAISRYRKGERVPDPDGKQLRMLAEGIAELSDGSLDAHAVHNDLAVSISGISVDYGTFLANLGVLLDALSANNNELARALNFDPSYISRILTGQRRPADTSAFVAGVSRFVARRCSQDPAPERVVRLVGENWGAMPGEDQRTNAIARWLTTNYAPVHNSVSSFIERLDAFDLDDFIRSIQFDDMDTPPAQQQLPASKTYFGTAEFMEAELDFLKATMLSKSSSDVTMFSNMPFESMAANKGFARQWMYGLALMLKKGLHLNQIHDTSRPLPEMLLGLEAWIPMYMTGQISPFYFKDLDASVFNTIIRVSGTVALQGEAVAGHHDEGRYVLTTNRDEVRYYQKRADRLLEKASPLMHIVTAENTDQLEAFYEKDVLIEGPRRAILSTLPISTMPAALLERVLDRAGVGGDEREIICAHARRMADYLSMLLDKGDVVFEISSFSEEEFAEHPPALDLAGLFLGRSIAYTPDEYSEHLAALRALAESDSRCTLIMDARIPFRNTQIVVCADRYAVVSKNVSPAIIFVIEHPAMVAAFGRFSAPLVE